MKPTLLVLAAGMGSRYGALKQMDGVGPNNEAILDYSIFDAKRAGFGKVVFVIRKDFAEAFEKINSTERFGMPVEYVYQSLDKLPEGFSIPEGRVKPWGTGHAVLMAADVIKEPFAVINADDFYGKEAYEVMAQYLTECEGKKGAYSMVAYKLRNTLSDFGTVSRGVCTQNRCHYLQTIVERTSIAKTADGAAYTDETGEHALDLDTLVSMNFFGFTPDFLGHLADGFKTFLQGPAQTNIKAEYYIPLEVNNQINSKNAKLKVLSSDAVWFGVTYKEDKPDVMKKIVSLIDKGVYPDKLW
ncbi:MAG: nucleotidyltransferase [Bacteroidales bacterium]|nr:nucleotidyltransferase [Bacteroidales bacterium]